MRHFVRSQRFSAAQLRDLVNVLLRRRPDDGTWGSCALDGREYYVGDPNVVLSYYPVRLTTLRQFRIARGKNDNVWEVTLSLRAMFDEEIWNRWARFGSALSREIARNAHITCYCDDGLAPRQRELGDFSVSASKRFREEPYAVLSLSTWGSSLSVERKHRFISMALESIGAVANEGFKADTSVAYTVRKVDTADGLAAIDFTGVEGMSNAITMAKRILQSKSLGISRNCMRMSCTLIPPAYESMLDELNALSNDWHLTLYGSYADGVDPYAAEASQSPDGRFPIVTWNNNDGSEIFFEADIVPTPEGRFLEIHSNCDSMQTLLDEAEAATGVRFTPIDPSTASEAGAR